MHCGGFKGGNSVDNENCGRCHNAMEMLLFEKLDELLPKAGNFCGCEKCRMDIAAIALNRLPQTYVASKKGDLFIKAEGMKKQMSADITAAVLEAVKIVSSNPRHS